ncbi:MAG: selenocysteine-specific translation elongation factor [Aliishimia sp.]
MKTCCVVVIGHVDHGKTSLVRALSGIETDRLPEEKARGLSIAPGFAHHSYPVGIIDFIDAPGHEDFIQAMISGATGASAALIVVSAVEGIGAQTLEHLNIAQLLGIENGVIVVTKCDLLAPSDHATRLSELRADLSHTQFSDVPIIMCSALTGEGLESVHTALQNVLSKATDTRTPLQSFLPIDRVFSAPGHGTIVTGTLLGRSLHVGDPVVVQPQARKTTIRGLQSRGLQRDHIHAGERIAVNLRGLAVDDVSRSSVLCVGSSDLPSETIDVTLDVQPNATRALKHMEDVRVLFGTTSEVASVRLFGGGRVAPGKTGFAQLRFKKPVMGFAGQRAILRCLSPAETLGGAIFLDPQARPARSGDKGRLRVLEAAQSCDMGRIAQALCQTMGGVANVDDIARLSRTHLDSVRDTLGDGFQFITANLVCARANIETCKAKLLAALAAFHIENPLCAMADRQAIADPKISLDLQRFVEAELIESEDIRRHDNKLALDTHDPIATLNADQLARLDEIEHAWRQSGLAPPSIESFAQGQHDKDLFALLVDLERLVSVRNVSLKQTLVFHKDALRSAAISLATCFPSPQDFTTSDARTALATSRRVIVPVLEHLDANGVTVRTGNARQMVDPNLVSPTN